MIKSKRKIYFYPRTRMGKVSFWIVLICFGWLCSNYWISIATGLSMGLLGLFFVPPLVICGITSIVSVWKNRDYSVLLFLTSLVGVFAIFLVIGEFVFPH